MTLIQQLDLNDLAALSARVGVNNMTSGDRQYFDRLLKMRSDDFEPALQATEGCDHKLNYFN